MTSSPVIIVTGAAGGIGYETVRILLQVLNAKVVASDLNVDRLKALKDEFSQSLEIHAADIAEPQTASALVATALESFGKLDGICLIAGIFGPYHRLEDTDVSEWEKAFRISVFSHLHMHVQDKRRLFREQLKLEEPLVTTVGVSPGLCDTKMVRDLMKGRHIGQTAEDVACYNSFVAKIPLITPTVAGNAFARTVVSAESSLSGQVLDYDDARLPLDEAAKRGSGENRVGNMDYTKFTT